MSKKLSRRKYLQAAGSVAAAGALAGCLDDYLGDYLPEDDDDIEDIGEIEEEATAVVSINDEQDGDTYEVEVEVSDIQTADYVYVESTPELDMDYVDNPTADDASGVVPPESNSETAMLDTGDSVVISNLTGDEDLQVVAGNEEHEVVLETHALE